MVKLSVSDAAKYVGRSVYTLQWLVRKGKLPFEGERWHRTFDTAVLDSLFPRRDPERVTAAEAARLTGKSKAAIFRALRAGKLHPTKGERGYNEYDPDELDKVFDIKIDFNSWAEPEPSPVDPLPETPVKLRGALAEITATAWLLKSGWEVHRNVAAHGAADLMCFRDGETRHVDVKSQNSHHSVPCIQPTTEQQARGIVFLIVRPDGECYWRDPREELPSRDCANCDKLFQPETRRDKYCSEDCSAESTAKKITALRAKHAYVHKAHAEVPCAHCGELFVQYSPNNRWCPKPECKRAARRDADQRFKQRQRDLKAAAD